MKNLFVHLTDLYVFKIDEIVEPSKRINGEPEKPDVEYFRLHMVQGTTDSQATDKDLTIESEIISENIFYVYIPKGNYTKDDFPINKKIPLLAVTVEYIRHNHIWVEKLYTIGE